MALVSAAEMLTKAKAGKYAVGQFNINNLEWTKSILLTAEEFLLGTLTQSNAPTCGGHEDVDGCGCGCAGGCHS